jgi:phosphatidate cytidylyltransferase
MKSLPVRATSAIIAIAIMFSAYHFMSLTGLLFIGLLVGLVSMHEYYVLTVRRHIESKFFQLLFYVSNILILFVSLPLNVSNILYDRTPFVILTMTLAALLLLVVLIWLAGDKLDNAQLLQTTALTTLGLFYCSLLPSFALKILYLPNGLSWFLLLLSIVFAGDTFAFFAGNFFGNKKLMVAISPSKTIAGFWGGLVGSLLVGAIVSHLLLPTVAYEHLAIVALIGSIFSQTGDLFESLIKRVAGVKDSGLFMPGHGGALDRVDSIYFAAPVIYTAAVLLTGHA